MRTFLQAIEALLARYELPPHPRLLDVGCGVGHYSELLELRWPGRFDYTGSDFSPEMIRRARRRWPGRRFVVDDVFESVLDLDSFDVICAGALVDVLSDYERALDILLGARAPFFLLHRQRMTFGRSRVEHARGYQGQRTVATFLDWNDLEAISARHGRDIADSFVVSGDVRSFLLVHRAVASAFS